MGQVVDRLLSINRIRALVRPCGSVISPKCLSGMIKNALSCRLWAGASACQALACGSLSSTCRGVAPVNSQKSLLELWDLLR